MARAAVPHLKRAPASSTRDRWWACAAAHLLDYSATKGAIHAFTLSLASSLLEKASA